MFEQRRDVVLKAELDKVHRIMISCNSIISTETKRTFWNLIREMFDLSNYVLLMTAFGKA